MRLKHVTRAAHEAFINKGLRIEDIAALLDKRPSTIYNELNPYHEGPAKLGADDLQQIVREYGILEPLAFMARDLGCQLVDLRTAQATARSKDPQGLLDLGLQAMASVGPVADAIRDGLAHGQLTKADVKRLTHAIWNVIELMILLDHTVAGASK